MKQQAQTLAGRIIEFSNFPQRDQLERLTKSQMELEKLENPMSDPLVLQKNLQLIKQGNAHSLALLAEAYAPAINSAKYFAEHVRNAARFQLTPNVLRAIKKMVQSVPVDRILEHFSMAKPPFEKLWFEYDSDEIDQDLNLGYQAKVGFLTSFDRSSGITLRRISWLDKAPHAPIWPRPEATTQVTGDGITFSVPEDYKVRDANGLKRRMELGGKIALCTFLLMNSRSKVIKAEPEVRPRGKLGYVEPVGLRPIVFDLSRVLRNYPGVSAEDAQRILSEQMVRGHFKVRKTGVWFWSPHIRNIRSGSTPEEAWDRQLKRDRQDIIRHPDRALTTPTGTPLPGDLSFDCG